MDIQAIRQDFPILKRQINNYPLIYFDNAATTQKPTPSNRCHQRLLRTTQWQRTSSSPHSIVEATDLYEKSREKIAKFINAKELAELVFVRGTTEAINLVAYSWGLNNLQKGDEVLVSLMEHHSNIVPWEITSKL